MIKISAEIDEIENNNGENQPIKKSGLLKRLIKLENPSKTF